MSMIERGDLVIYHSTYPKQKEFYTIAKVKEIDGQVHAYFENGEWMPADELTLVCKAKDRLDSVRGDGVDGYKNPEMSPDYIAYILRISDYKEDGWDFHRNPDGKLYAFHPAFGSRLFHSEVEFKEWLFFK